MTKIKKERKKKYWITWKGQKQGFSYQKFKIKKRGAMIQKMEEN